MILATILALAASAAAPYSPGERMGFSIDYGGMRVGTASISVAAAGSRGVPVTMIGMGGGNSSLIDTLPTGLQFVTDTETLTWSPPEVTVITTSRNINNSGAQQLVNWYFDAITSTLDEATIVTLTLQAQATGVQINTGATVFSPPAAVYTPVNNVSLWQRGLFVGSSTAQNRIIQPVLSIAKSVTPAANSYVGSNQPITYTLAVANSSNGPAYDIVISDVLPSGVIFDSSIIALLLGLDVLSPRGAPDGP